MGLLRSVLLGDEAVGVGALSQSLARSILMSWRSIMAKISSAVKGSLLSCWRTTPMLRGEGGRRLW